MGRNNAERRDFVLKKMSPKSEAAKLGGYDSRTLATATDIGYLNVKLFTDVNCTGNEYMLSLQYGTCIVENGNPVHSFMLVASTNGLNITVNTSYYKNNDCTDYDFSEIHPGTIGVCSAGTMPMSLSKSYAPTKNSINSINYNSLQTCQGGNYANVISATSVPLDECYSENNGDDDYDDDGYYYDDWENGSTKYTSCSSYTFYEQSLTCNSDLKVI